MHFCNSLSAFCEGTFLKNSVAFARVAASANKIAIAFVERISAFGDRHLLVDDDELGIARVRDVEAQGFQAEPALALHCGEPLAHPLPGPVASPAPAHRFALRAGRRRLRPPPPCHPWREPQAVAWAAARRASRAIAVSCPDAILANSSSVIAGPLPVRPQAGNSAAACRWYGALRCPSAGCHGERSRKPMAKRKPPHLRSGPGTPYQNSYCLLLPSFTDSPDGTDPAIPSAPPRTPEEGRAVAASSARFRCSR